jgi:UDP-N-acetylmuramoylalanine--D-glutamate ligase
VAILGAGKSGLGAARLAKHLGIVEIVIFDTAPSEKLVAITKICQDEHYRTVFGDEALAEALAAATHYQLVVISPGMDESWPLPQAFTKAGVPLLGEMQFACLHTDQPIVALTGTNGKTTTTEIVDRIFNGCGQRTVASGNIGTPLSELVARREPMDVITLECSSFQLETISSFRPNVAIWLNFAPDHLDRYVDEAAYFAAKQRIFENQTAEDVAIVNRLEPVPTGKARCVTFSSEPGRAGADFTYEKGWISYRGERVAHFAATRLRGKHNAENLMAALAAGVEFGLSFPDMMVALGDYMAPRHRCELVRTWQGREFLNDSKATNLHALESALRALETDQPLILIAGGKEKGLDYSPLISLVKEKVAFVLAIGQIGGKLCEVWGEVVPCYQADSVAEAVAQAMELSRPGQTILFSPGTSSFDMFTGYEERGNVFCQAVHSLS